LEPVQPAGIDAKQYGFITDQLSGSANSPGPGRFQTWVNTSLSFPDFKHVVIHRPTPDGRKWTSYPGGCQRDSWSPTIVPGTLPCNGAMRWKFPKTDHPVSDVWQGLTSSAGTNLIHCISRSVKIVVQGTSTEFKPTLEYATQTLQASPSAGPAHRSLVRAVLDQSKLIRFSFRPLPREGHPPRSATGKKLEWILDCSGDKAPDLWLRDGDVIEVPEKP